jgi:nucleotide-binding universal stress UspA family protein
MVEPSEGPAHSSPVVVGVDGSEQSLRALRWAHRQASLMGAPLDVVTAWTFPETPAPLGIPVHVPYQEQLVAQAHTRLDEIVAEVLPERRQVRTRVLPGGAAAVLLAEARSASLLVVGTRGEGFFDHLLIGSVSERCVRHAPCPVVVVP